METTSNNSKHTLASIGWGALFIWWGISFMVGPITIGLSMAGTGAILLGINVARLIMGIPANHSTHDWGVIALVWGILDHTLKLTFEQSTAMLLIVIGVVIVTTMLVRRMFARTEQATGL